MIFFGIVSIRCVQRTTRFDFVLINVIASRVGGVVRFVRDPAGTLKTDSILTFEIIHF